MIVSFQSNTFYSFQGKGKSLRWLCSAVIIREICWSYDNVSPQSVWTFFIPSHLVKQSLMLPSQKLWKLDRNPSKENKGPVLQQ